MLPVTRDLDIYKGDTFSMVVRLWEKTVDGQAGDLVVLTGAAAKAQIRANADATVVAAEMTTQITDPGVITLILSPSQTASLVDGVWDLQITFADGTIRTYIKGSVTVSKDVTRGA